MTTEMASTEGEADEESSEEASGGVDGSQSPSQRGQTERELCRSPGSLYIEARLHPLDVDIVLKAAPSEEVAQAWRKGTVAPPFRHRLKLRAHKEFADEEAGMRVLYDEGRKFWEEG